MHGHPLQTEPLLDGDPGTAQTIAKIREYVHQGKNDPAVNQFTGKLLRAARVPSYDRTGEVRAIFEWVLRNIRFQQDPVDAECLRWARTTLEWGFGDCDDINAILLPSMLKTAGHHARLVTIASHPAAPEQFSHIYCEAHVDGKWIPLDAARSGTRFGSAPSRHYRKRVWSLEDATYQDLSGCGAGCCMRLGTHMRLDGLGRYYRASGLGQFDWSEFANVLNAAGGAASNVVRAVNAPALPVFPSMPGYPPPAGVATAAYPAGYAPGIYPGGGVSAVGSISSPMLLLLGLGAVLLIARR
jgi:hypothetical protein